ncbi:DUF6678 family protein [Caldalkalibacillus mannanilyticus]|uniref:DUF6678 family protein n=1 Tax=Caldalkalibacillus mannanilyticus TaxID=1418 RepID=UPI00046ADA61|nr:DUF6678 family protein [Caldalkalibacillus mannanilyticus]
MDRRMESLKKNIQSVLSEKQLHPIMNNTKWKELQSAVINTLPFPPPYQVKYVLEETPEPISFDNDVWYFGDWNEGLSLFYSVEWIRVRPRYLKHRGVLIDDELIDITVEFLRVLHHLNIPYIEESNSYYIFGYTSNTDKLFSKK